MDEGPDQAFLGRRVGGKFQGGVEGAAAATGSPSSAEGLGQNNGLFRNLADLLETAEDTLRTVMFFLCICS
jgi:hypothetical protein